MLPSPAPLPVASFLGAFLLAFPALFSIVNPIGSALIFKAATADRSAADRHKLARRVSLYAAGILIGSIWIGGFILNVFGISLPALRIAGGLVVSVSAWTLLTEPERDESQKTESAPEPGRAAEDIAFFPLAMPITTGPGTMAVAIALASQRPAGGAGALQFFAGLTLAAVAIAALVRVAYRWSDAIFDRLGASGVRVLSRLAAFILLCVGVQIISTGVESLVAGMGKGPPA